MKERPSGFILVLLFWGVVSFSFSPILVRLASDAPGLAIAVWRTGLASILLMPFAWHYAGEEIRSFGRKDRFLILIAGICLGFHFITWIESLYHTSVASASVLVSTSPLFLAVLGYVLLKEALSLPTIFAIVCAVVGAAVIGWTDAVYEAVGERPLLGNGLALFAALLVSAYLLIGRVVRQSTSWLAYVFPLYTVAALTALAVAWIQGVPVTGYGWTFYGLCLLMAIGPQILGHGSFNYALLYVPAALVGVLALFEPIGAAVLAYVLFGEVPPGLAIVGMIVVLIAIAGIILQRRRVQRVKQAD